MGSSGEPGGGSERAAGVQREPSENCGDCMVLHSGTALHLRPDAHWPEPQGTALSYRFTPSQDPTSAAASLLA